MWLNLMKIEVHERQTPWPRHQFLAEVCRLTYASCRFPVERAFGFLPHPLVRGNQESPCAACRIADCELVLATRGGTHNPHHRANQRSRSEVLTGPFLAFSRRLFKQAFEGCRLDVHIKHGPVRCVDLADQLRKADRISKAIHCAGEDVAQHSLLLAERRQDAAVVLSKCGARLLAQVWPVTLLREGDPLLISHLEEEQVR